MRNNKPSLYNTVMEKHSSSTPLRHFMIYGSAENAVRYS